MNGTNGTGTQYVNASGGTINNAYQTIGNKTLYAKWTANTYTVTMDPNGGVNGSNYTSPWTSTYGNTYNLDSYIPTRNDYTFAGWYDARTGGYKYTGNWTWTATGNFTFYAHWNPNTYYVHYDANGGTGAPATQSFLFDSGAKFSTTKPTRTGYTFVNWKYSTSTFNPGDAIPKGWRTFTVTAQWTPNTYTVSYNTGGGSACSAKTVTYDSTYGTLCTTSRAGYTFAGWFNSVGTQVTSSTKVTTASNHTLTAHWTANTYTITYNSNGGTACNPTTKSVTFGSGYGTLCTTSRTGYTFAGWWTAASGGSQVTSSTTVGTASNHTIYAHWTGNPYTITYVGGACNPATKSVTFGSGYGTLCAPTQTGYTFAGWWTAASGGSQVTSSTTVGTASNHNLYARWNANKYTLTYNNNNGTGCTSTMVTYNSNYPALCVPSRTGYDFVGWFTAASGGSQVTSSVKVTTAGNHTIYAHWKEKCLKVTLNGNGGTAPVASIYLLYTKGWYTNSACTTDLTNFKALQPSRTDYRFRGWYTTTTPSTTTKIIGQSSGIQSGKTTVCSNDCTLYAGWSDMPIITEVKYDPASTAYNLAAFKALSGVDSSFKYEYAWRVLQANLGCGLPQMRAFWGWYMVDGQQFTNTGNDKSATATKVNTWMAIRNYDVYRFQMIRSTTKAVQFKPKNYSTNSSGFQLGYELKTLTSNKDDTPLAIGGSGGTSTFDTWVTKNRTAATYCKLIEDIG